MKHGKTGLEPSVQLNTLLLVSASSSSSPTPSLPKGGRRGTELNPPNRFERIEIVPDPDADLGPEFSESISVRTQFFFDSSESLLTTNDSPDVGFSVGLNAYRGCEHGCAYCYARPFHDYLGWNSGLDFETKVLVKLKAPALLREELAAKKWIPQPVAMSGVTDCYQPAERHFKLTRSCLEVFAEFKNPVGIITKNFLVTRDLDILVQLARWRGVVVTITLTTLDADLAGQLEPRAARPEHRLRAIRQLSEAGIPVGVMIAPVIPGLTDHEIPALLGEAFAAGARQANYVVLRLPWSVKEIFTDWLERWVPQKKERVLSRVRALRGGQLNVSEWGERMRGEGIFAEQIRGLFHASARRVGFRGESVLLAVDQFVRPGGTQLTFF